MADWSKILGNLGGLQGVGALGMGIGSAFSAAAARRQQRDQQALQNALLRYNAQMEARGAQAAAARNAITDAQAAAVNLAAAMPLGAEQALAQRNAKTFGMMEGMAGRSAPSGYGGVFNPFATIDRTAWSPEATTAAIQQRRKVAAGIDPRFQFDSMGAYGLGDTTAADRSVADYQAMLQKESADRQARLDALLADQMAAARAFNPDQILQQANGSGGNRNVLNAILRLGGAAAPAIAAAMRAPAGTNRWNAFGSAMTTPAAIARMAGAAIGGPVGSALQIGSSFIPTSTPSRPLTDEEVNARLAAYGLSLTEPTTAVAAATPPVAPNYGIGPSPRVRAAIAAAFRPQVQF